MRVAVSLFFCLMPVVACAQQTPLTILPYTPALERNFMDTSVDPCADFYRYACGNWSKLNPMPPDEDSWSVYGKLALENERLLWGILEQARQNQSQRTPNEQKVGDLFGACMNTAAVDQADAKPLEPGLKRIAGLESKIGIASYVAEQHREGIDQSVLFNFSSGQDFDDSTRVIGFVFASGLGLPDRDYYSNTDPKSQEIRQKYVEHVERTLALIGESGPDAAADARSIMDIETALAKVSLTRVEKRNPYNLKHRITRDELIGKTPAFDWDTYFSALHAPETQDLNIAEPKFLSQLNTELENRKLGEWKAYLRWHLVHSHAPYLAQRFEREDFDFFDKYLTGVSEQPPRWKKCTRIVDGSLGEALGQVFVSKTFAPRTKEDALTMTKQIEQEMEEDIRQLSWMSQSTKEQALIKLHAIVNKIGYPDKWRDYSSVQIVPQDFVFNVAQAAAFEQRRDLAKIGKPVDRAEWQMTPPTVNAYYNPQMNDINFPAGVLQPPLFDSKLDQAPNYGDTGATIGHELTHGFDDEGRQFDAHGNLKDWWTVDDAQAFEKRTSCVRDQYAGYTIIDDIKINSRLTLGEDVADLGGTLLAYLAWKHATEGQNLSVIDGFTPDQRFFIGMAQWACAEQRPESKRMHAITDPHSPDAFRVNGVVSDLPQFGAAFGCKAGQPMVRVNACRVW